MTDLIRRLREPDTETPWTGKGGLFQQAADEIERLHRYANQVLQANDTLSAAKLTLLGRLREEIARRSKS